MEIVHNSDVLKDLFIFANHIAAQRDPEELMQKVVDRIFISFKGVMPTIFKNDHKKRIIKIQAIPKIRQTRESRRITGKTLGQMRVSYEKRKNFVVRSTLNNEIIKTNDLYNIGRSVISRNSARAIQDMLGMREIILLPIRCKSITFGTLLLGSESFKDLNLSLLQKYVNYVALSLYNLEQVRKLKLQAARSSRSS